MPPAKSDTDPGEDGSVQGVSDMNVDEPQYEPIPPRWGSENEVTLVFTGDTSQPLPSVSSPSSPEYSLRAILERAERVGRIPPLLVVLDVLSQACARLGESVDRPKGPADEVAAHGGLNPRRIFVSAEGKVRIDWNLDTPARGESAPSEESYESPEQLRGLPIDSRSDVFSLTLSICELLVLKQLVSDRNKVLAGPGVSDLAAALRGGKRIPREIGRVILRGLAKDAEQRYTDVAALTGALRDAADEIGMTIGNAETGRFVRELFDDNNDLAENAEVDDEHESDFLEADDERDDDDRDDDDIGDEDDDDDDDAHDDDAQISEWGNLDVFASLAKPTSTPPPPSWAASLTQTQPPRSSVAAPTPHIPPPPPLPAAPARRPMAAPTPVERDATYDLPTPPRAEPAVAPPSRPLPPALSPPQPSTRAKSSPPVERARTLPPPPPPVLSPPPMRGRGMGTAVDVEAKRPLESEPPSALTRSVQPLAIRLPGFLSGGLRGPVSWKAVAILGGVVAVAFLLVSLFSSKSGTVVIAAAGNLGQPLGNVTVVADGLKTCEGESRCVFQLAPGLHEMNVRADGYVGQERVIVIRAGEQSAVEFRLERSVSWLKLAARQDGTEVFVDDELAGVLPNQMPQSIEVPSGPHRVRIAAKHFAPEEQKIDLAPGETRFLGGIALRAIIGKAAFDVRTPGADLSLISETGQQQHVDPSQPVELDLSKRWVVEARRDGYSTFREPLNWNGDLEKTFVVTLERPGAELPAPRPVSAAPRTAPRYIAAAPAAAPEPAAAAVEPATSPAEERAPAVAAVPPGLCAVSFNSIPVSSVFLDGSRIGSTPQLRVPIRPGNHSVEFSRGDAKRKRSFRCSAGESKVIALNLGS